MIRRDRYCIGEMDLSDHSSIYDAAGRIWTMTGQLSFCSKAAVCASTLTTEVGRHLNSNNMRGRILVSIEESDEGDELVLEFTSTDVLPDVLVRDIERLCAHLDIRLNNDRDDSIEARIRITNKFFDLSPNLIRSTREESERKSLIEQLYTALLAKHAQARKHLSELREREKQLMASRDSLREMSSELALSEERERKRLATALHSSVLQSMSATAMKLKVLEDMVSGEEPSKLLGSVRKELSGELQALRSLTFELSPPILYELGLSAAISWLGEKIMKQGIVFEFRNRNGHCEIEQTVQIVAFQCVKEVLENVRKHSKARKVIVTETIDDTRLSICIEDDGKGFDPDVIVGAAIKRSSLGLLSMKERVRQAGGDIVIDSKPGHGSVICFHVPLSVKDESVGKLQEKVGFK